MPEPATIALAAGGALLAMAAGRRWRARRPGGGGDVRA
ncbi:MAG: hypothetical protein HS113_10250 [Verrucomicrobiales bacterium]|nr:hypothetical protein [Verrucomicrobiales bacterium]